MQINPLTPPDFAEVIELGNLVHGDNYLSDESLQHYYARGIKNNINASFVVRDDNNKLIAFRLTFAAGNWPLDKWCSTALWPVKQEQMGYFKTSAILASEQGKGIGGAMLKASVLALKQQGAHAGVTHLWRQSPGNAAVKYFTKAGGVLIKIHPDRWLQNCLDDGYVCTLCGNECHCDAAEMVLIF